MKYVIDEEVCKKSYLDMPSVLTILLLNTGTNFEDKVKELVDREILIEEKTLLGTKYSMTNRWINTVSSILLDSEKSAPDEFNDKLDALSKRLMEVFPAGKKAGTTIYWKGNCRDIKLRLKKFFKKYGDTYTDDQIVEAARAYVNSFNGDYSYMRVLKYFIWKDERKLDADGYLSVEEVSDLATILENAGQTDINHKSDIGELV